MWLAFSSNQAVKRPSEIREILRKKKSPLQAIQWAIRGLTVIGKT